MEIGNSESMLGITLLKKSYCLTQFEVIDLLDNLFTNGNFLNLLKFWSIELI